MQQFPRVCVILAALSILPASTVGGVEAPAIESPAIGIGLDPITGLPARIETRLGSSKRQWLAGPVRLAVRHEVTSSKATLATASENDWQRRGESLAGSTDLAGLPLKAVQQWSLRANAVAWEIDFRGDATRAGHEVTIELPLLAEDSKVFTPTERGVMEIAAYPTFQGLPYASVAGTPDSPGCCRW